MIRTRLTLDRDFVVGVLDRRIFGAFVEHLGRCVYTGIYEPGHPTADAQGLRGDVLALTRELGVTTVRYPGGNFLSGYDWEDGVGPAQDRPVRLDLAWHSTETNRFGTNEFIAWCRAAGVAPMLGVNLGTRGADAARRYLEYCNHPGGTALSDLRRSHGCAQPHGVRDWCLGNEMDAPWQIGQKTAGEYGRLARDTARLMRWLSPDVQLIACGSSNRELPTFGAWEDQVLEQCFDEVDYLSVHTYFENPHADTWEFLGNIDRMDLHIKEVAAIADAVAARRHSLKRILLAVDEWNIWYKARAGEHARQPGWPQAPRLIEEVYNFEDALAAGGALSVLMNNAGRVKIACLAQLVNAIGAIRTEPGGAAWRQTIFHPFALAARHARGQVLRCAVDAPARRGQLHPEMPYLVASATWDEASGRIAVFALNRHLSEEQDLRIELRGMPAAVSLHAAVELHHADMNACNTEHAPDAVAPHAHGRVQLEPDGLRARLKPGSWNVFVLGTR
ncbi:alpha-N-arabinofuranosidase [Ramlibacter sp.]|uniref:arabinosylfuranosidase ArfA n=1 Tax=Ramlibacter sp. TaxID=1917967 RepID=UPI001797BBA3|nr:alpha-N-arabinofuranosidase [Ramlibacter sp.]MBA2676436.1 alpha-N-arabinofuranosidase [Ramlibacter sp.]